MKVYDWNEKLAEGKAGEEQVLAYWQGRLGANELLHDLRDDPAFRVIDVDFAVVHPVGGTVWYEIKTDLRAHETGNLFLEFEALETSKADYWLIFVPQRGWLFQFNRANLLKLARENWADSRTVHSEVRGGRLWTATGVPMRMSELLLHLTATLYTGITTGITGEAA